MTKALGIIDMERGFMPPEEGERLQLPGFGELPVPGGHEIIPNINRLAGAFAMAGYEVFTTQDWHPEITAHFSHTPDYKTNWPVHCVAGTPGAALHPDLELPEETDMFIKGFEVLQSGREDTSYSALHAEKMTGPSLQKWFRMKRIGEVTLVGVAEEYCVGLSGLDFANQLGLKVNVVADAVRAITPEGSTDIRRRFDQAGIQMPTTDEVLATLETRV